MSNDPLPTAIPPAATSPPPYRGRLAPSPTGSLHLGHARTFWTAQQRAQSHGGVLLLRNEDLDHPRCKPQFVTAMFDDLRWFGLQWQEGPDCGGPLGPYSQSERGPFYAAAFEKLRAEGFIYPCACSRQDVLRALAAPHQGEEEPIYPGTCWPRRSAECERPNAEVPPTPAHSALRTPRSAFQINWRFRVPDGAAVAFQDGGCGPQEFVAGQDFGDFVVWRHDGIPAYPLAVVVDDAAMQITEVVRGADLLLSTARQVLLYRALGLEPPAFFHCPLLTDEQGRRPAKRHAALSLRALRASGASPEFPAFLRALFISPSPRDENEFLPRQVAQVGFHRKRSPCLPAGFILAWPWRRAQRSGGRTAAGCTHEPPGPHQSSALSQCRRRNRDGNFSR